MVRINKTILTKFWRKARRPFLFGTCYASAIMALIGAAALEYSGIYGVALFGVSAGYLALFIHINRDDPAFREEA